MTSLQIGLIVGGIALVVGVIIYNWLQERRMRRKLAAAKDSGVPDARSGRVEPTLARSGSGDEPPPWQRPKPVAASGPRPAQQAAVEKPAEAFVSPVEIVRSESDDIEEAVEASPAVASEVDSGSRPALKNGSPDKSTQPDHDTECVVILQPARPIAAGALGAGLHAKVGKPLRWLGRSGPSMPWQLLRSDTPGEFIDIAACLLLADRAGPVTKPLMDRFVSLARDVATGLAATFTVPNVQSEIDRAEALDRLCGDLDVQIGLTVLKPSPAMIAGTRLRGVAEAAGFRLTDNGRFDWVQEETGYVLYSLQNYRSEPFTAESLRLTSTPGAVFVLDVPRVADPVRVFDQMKLVAKRMTTTLDAALVDDNRRPLDDAALAAIREQVQATATALKEIHIIPGSPRALALFGG